MSSIESSSTGVRRLRRATALAVPVALLVSALTGMAPAVVPAGAAMPTLRCDDGLVYLTRSDGEVDQTTASTGRTTGVPLVDPRPGESHAEALGVGRDGAALDVVHGQVLRYGRGPAATVAPDTQLPSVGAVDPTSAVFYSGGFSGSTLVLNGLDPKTRGAVGGTVTVRLRHAPGPDGDIAFDGSGRLYVVASSATRASTYVTSSSLPTHGSSPTSLTARLVGTVPTKGAVTGAAFAADGGLYVSTARTIRRLDPTDDRAGDPVDLSGGLPVTDLGSCATPHVAEPAMPAAAGPSAAGAGSAGLSLSATASPASVSRVGQPIAYTFVARNTGPKTVAGLLVRASFRGLSAPVCSPVALGGDLAPGATTTCRATRTTALADLENAVLSDAAKASGTVGTQAVNATASVSVAVRAWGPQPVDGADVDVSAITGGPSVILPGSTNDLPGEPGGPAVDPSRTELVGYPPLSATKVKNGARHVAAADGSQWWVLPDGSVRFQAGRPALAQLDYRVHDTAGRTAVGHLRVTVRPGPTCPGPGRDQLVPHPTLPGQPITVDVLAACTPGQTADGATSAFDRDSVRLVAPGHAGTLADDHRHLRVTTDRMSYPDVPSGNAAVGDFTVNADGTVTFVPAPGYPSPGGPGDVPVVEVTAVTTAGVPVVAYLDIAQVSPASCWGTYASCVDIDVAFPSLDTAYGHPVVFQAAATSTTSDPADPIDPGATVLTPGQFDNEKRVPTYQGTWQVNDADGSITFSPADGFVGATAEMDYTVYDLYGDHRSGRMTAHVQAGPKALPDLATGPGRLTGLAPLADDVPGPHADGTPGSFVATSLVLPATGQPRGALLGGSSRVRTLTVPGEGVWELDQGQPLRPLSFTPAAGFTGGTSPITYQVTDDSGNVATGRVTGAVTSNAPSAVADEASTTLATPVSLPGLIDDLPGTAPLVVGATAFPGAGQPPSAAVAADGKSVTVPGQGTWTVRADGSASFAPTATYVGTTTPVTYRVVDTTGRASTATLRVTVQPGPVGHPAAVALPEDYGVVQALMFDAPGRNADGTLGSMDPASLRFALDGQPAGWKVNADGKSAFYHVGDQKISVPINAYGVTFSVLLYNVTGTAGPLVYTAQDTVRDATGVARHQTLGSTVQASLTQHGPIATDDHAATTSGVPAVLAGPRNDLTRSRFDLDRTTFPSDQLKLLPAGSTVGHVGAAARLTVAGEGTYLVGSDWTIAFTPVRGFVGAATRVQYEVSDVWGSTARATLNVTVHPQPEARPDAATTGQNQAVTVDVLTNDDPGSSPERLSAPYPRLPDDDLPTGWTGSYYGDRLTVPGQGVYVVNRGSDVVTFSPEPQFSGRATPIAVDLGAVAYGREVTSTLSVTVTASTPRSADDTATTALGRPVTVPVLANDGAGPGATLAGSSVRLRLAPGLPTGSALYGDAKTLTVPGHGVFLVAGDGAITFVPIGSAAGPAPVVGYQVADTNGSTTRSSLRVTVR